jgi:hypothetical protein
MEEATNTSSAVDRRALLKKAAVAGTVAWVAPTVLTSPALAQTASGGGGPVPGPIVLPSGSARTSGQGSRRDIDIDFSATAMRALLCSTSSVTFSIVSGPAGTNIDGGADVEIPNAGNNVDLTFTIQVRTTATCPPGSTAPRCVRLTYTARRNGSTATVTPVSGQVCPL